MTNTQFYLIIGVPSFFSFLTSVTAILACLSLRRQARRICDKIDKFCKSSMTDTKPYTFPDALRKSA